MGLISRPDASPAVSWNPQTQEGWITTRLDFLVNWGRANSLWPMPFGTACCAIEFMATAASKFDLARFGIGEARHCAAQEHRGVHRRHHGLAAGPQDARDLAEEGREVCQVLDDEAAHGQIERLAGEPIAREQLEVTRP